MVKPAEASDDDTKALSREHTVLVSRSGLVTVTGGKWTTYRAMAEDVLGKCMADALLPHRPGGATLKQLLVGANAVNQDVVTAAGLLLLQATVKILCHFNPRMLDCHCRNR